MRHDQDFPAGDTVQRDEEPRRDDEQRDEEPRTPASGELDVDVSEAHRLALIREAIASVRPGIQRDGGDIELIAVEYDLVRVRLSGACTHCGMAGQTLGGLRRTLMSALEAPIRVVPAP